MGISSPGIGSNLDVNGIVSKLMSVESQPLADLDKKEASYQAEVSAFGALSGALGTFQSAMATLASAATFQRVNATASDSTVLSGTATNKAVAGAYSVNVTQLAQAQTLATSGQTSTSATLGDGVATTLTFQFGTISGGSLQNGVYVNDPNVTPSAPSFTQDANHASGSVVIDSTNNTLAGIRDAINKAAIGVTATIVSDGSATPDHLVLTSNSTGANSSMKITVTRPAGAATDNTLSNLLAYDPAGTQNMTQSSAAQDSQLTVNGLAVSSHTTTVSEAIQGVTLSLSKVGTSTLTVAPDTASVTTAVNGMVTAYNGLNSMISKLTAWDPTTKTGGPLLGDSTVRAIQQQIRGMLGGNLPNASGALTNLPAIGVTFQKDGTLAVDSTKLQSAISSNFSDFAGLFAANGVTTDSQVSYVSSTSSTAAGSGALHINALATHGTVTGGAAPTTTTITAGSNDSLSLTVDGVSTVVTLAAGTYTTSSLVAEMQSAINGAPELVKAGIGVAVSADTAGVLTVSSNSYGSSSTIAVGGTAATSLMPSAVATAGTDVSGTINGATATGSGQYLTGPDGLKLQVTGGAAGADRGTVTFSRGFGDLMNTLITSFVGPGGLIAGSTNSLQSSISSLGVSRDRLNLQLTAIEARYRAQFTALDVSIGSMKSTSDYLTQQLASLQAQTQTH
jgi:flagellar hook-associated protein 2